ncbi:MAG: hypothetical protein KUG77_24010 [Nannocystaceae bacterium]|nr:hypothetical protein [Nannocystaceae bacterium]
MSVPPRLLLVCLFLATACQDLAASDSETADGAGDETQGADETGEFPSGVPDFPVYIQPTLQCRPPLAGEPEGASPGGDVCTWESIAGATEEGRRFRDYASCEVVRTQRPYYPVPPAAAYGAPDPRMEDPGYVSELDWVRAQIDASGCSCCHSSDAPEGPVRWSVDLPGNWVSSMNDRDVAALADWLDTSMFGRYAPAQNNGFTRAFGLPSTEPARAVAFFEDELDARGLQASDFADEPPTGGPLLEQAAFVPAACDAGEGVAPDGSVEWIGGPARYIYVLRAGSDNPTVPPNLDLPEGTVWRIDVPHTGTPVVPGAVQFPVVPRGWLQRHPAESAPSPLVAGEDYYLYVARDVVQPITRCLFTYEE